jgi:hypothetical protein
MYIVRKCQMYLYRNRQKNEAFLQLVYIYFISISNNSGTAKVKIVKNERDPTLFTSKQLIKY